MKNILALDFTNVKIESKTLTLSGSKSISNRLLIVNELYNNVLKLENVSNAEDTLLLKNALESNSECININHAGTAMRFLTAFYAIQEKKEITLSGSERMHERTIEILVKALRELGAAIEYLNKEGFPPLKISGKNITENKVHIHAEVSSQFLSALTLIGSKLQNGLEIVCEGKITSLPYLEMTISLQNQLGIATTSIQNQIKIPFTEKIISQKIFVESDWSSASYWFSCVAIGNIKSLKINYLYRNSTQGDSIVIELYKEYFGVKTEFHHNNITLSKIENFILPEKISIEANTFPDLAQTLLVTALILKIPIQITGLHTLKIKETDRILAMQNELEKCGATVIATKNSIACETYSEIKKNIVIQTYNDHRMAMAFAPLSFKVPLQLENPEVVEKSYPNFWKDLLSLKD